ncbi:MAG: 30S ribosomal protein S6 [Candidatus Pacebacteria bacterium]|jgi:ribosomal protein S6|nr:30S ribosomal protein S6 [Candidatus Paceibacterota bacterium]
MDHNEHTEPRVYELGYHLVPTLAVEQIPAASGAVRGMIEQISKDIIAEELPVFIDLAYTVIKTIDHKNKRFDQAYFGWVKFEANPEGIATLEEALKKDENVLRYLVVKTIKENTFIAKKFTPAKAKAEAEETVAEEVATEAVAEEAIDKAIEELVA